MILEVCANSYQSAKYAQEAGVSRIELCQELSVGGITPSFGLVKQVLDDLKLSVFVLIRPRGGDFVYTDAEFEIMKNNIQMCKDLGCHGIVSGLLNADHTIDRDRTQELVNLSQPLPFTFHRAFDEVKHPKRALEQLIDLGIERVLTSGQNQTAAQGLELLSTLHQIADNRIIVLAGGGIIPGNVHLFRRVGFPEIHASASTNITSNDAMFSVPLSYSDPKKIKAILDAI